jgi:exopolysaccharide biosynthesis protein
MPIGKCHHSVHVIEADLEQPDVVLEMLKAKNLASGLQKLHDIVRINDSVNNTKVLGAVNANFWKAYSNRPIGPAISGGEIVELPAHKRWSTCLVSDDKQLFIDNFIITGQLETADDNLFEINSVNSRNDSLGNILYNRFAGDSIPQLTYQAPVLEQDTTNEDFFIDDSTEENFDIAKYKSEKASGFIIDDIEYYLPKISLKYLDDPAINERTPCLVTSINTGVLSIPDDGCIITVGRDTPVDLMPKKGDTVYVEFSTNIHNDIIFVSGFSGTPRLVRNGNPKNEAAYEGNHGRRFMNKQLPRTAIGTDKSMKKAIIVAVEPSCRSERRSGASLQQMANIMKKLGCLNAMNLDGGGSTSMLINGKNVIYKGRPEAGRKISAAAAIMKKGV